MTAPFSFITNPILHFGSGKISELPALVKFYGSKILLVTGKKSFDLLGGYQILTSLKQKNLDFHRVVIDHEPTPSLIDDVVKRFSNSMVHVVVGIGGGSVLDGAKAIAAMLPLNESVKIYLEGVGTKNHSGVKVPFIAVPTTAGTGSEATKNAVLSEIGENGFKKSLRHNQFVPDAAIVDPQLMISCPKSITASSGMDAFTQLLESYLSVGGNSMTDAWAYEGLRKVSRSLRTVYLNGDDIHARNDMALAAYLSGVTLANAGLGLVHGFASPLGGYYDIPHGVICSTLMPEVNRITVHALRAGRGDIEALKKYACVGRLFTSDSRRSDAYCIDYLLEAIHAYKEEMKIPGLGTYGVDSNSYEKIVNGTGSKNHPVDLTVSEKIEILEKSS